MVRSHLNSFALMIRRLTCSPNLLIANGLNSFAKTLVLSLWIDLLFSSSFLLHLHLVLCIALFNKLFFFLVFFPFLLYFVFHIKIENKKNWKIRKIQKQCVFVYTGTYVPSMTNEIKFSKLCIFCSLNEHFYEQLSKWALWLVFVISKVK